MKDIKLNNLPQNNNANNLSQKDQDAAKIPSNSTLTDVTKNTEQNSSPKSKLDQFEKILAKTLNEVDNGEFKSRRKTRLKSARRRRSTDRDNAETTSLNQTDEAAGIDEVQERETSLQQQQDKFINTVKPMKKEAQISSYVINKQFADLTNILHKHGVKDKFEDSNASINHSVMRLMNT